MMKYLEKLHNKLEKEIPKAELQIPKIIATSPTQSAAIFPAFIQFSMVKL